MNFNSFGASAGFNQGYNTGMNPQLAQTMPAVKTHITTEDIREIVQRLNQKPFNQTLTLVTFDELSSLDLLELLNKTLIELDQKNNVNIKEELQETTANRMTDFLRVLNYPSTYDLAFQRDLVGGEKRTIYPIMYYILTNFPELQKRAYLAQFLVPIQVPEEHTTDEEMKYNIQQYKDLQAEFQVYHQQLEGIQKEAMNPTELKKEITQLEQEREQLNAKINMFKSKNTNRPDFQALLEVTNLLRKEQEEEARNAEKIRTQRQQLEWSDQQLLSAQQRLIDAKKALSGDNTPEQMLKALKNEVKKNRELAVDRLGLEIAEKRKKLENIETILSEPSISSDELQILEHSVIMLRRNNNELEERLKREQESSDHNDKLAIYKQQAALVTKKKERMLEDLKKVEEEKDQLEKDIQKKEEQLQKLRGPGYKSKDDFKEYANSLKEKTTKFKKMKDELKEIRTEITILSRTEHILKNSSESNEQLLKTAENKKGISGYHSIQQGMELVSEKKADIDSKKEVTLDEISKIVINIENQLKQKKTVLQPKIKDLKDVRKKYEDIEVTYKEKKKEYENVTASIESDISSLETEVKKLKEDVYLIDTKKEMLKYNTQILELKISRLSDEAEFSKGSKTLDANFRSYKDFFTQKISKLDAELKELKSQRDLVKENHEPSLKQMKMFTDLKRLLSLKMQVIKNEAGYKGNDSKKQEEFDDGNVNRLVLRE